MIGGKVIENAIVRKPRRAQVLRGGSVSVD